MNLVESISNPIFAKQTSLAGLSLSGPPLTLEDFCPRGCDLPYHPPPYPQGLGGLQLVLRDNTFMVGLGAGFVVTLQFSVLLQLRL